MYVSSFMLFSVYGWMKYGKNEMRLNYLIYEGNYAAIFFVINSSTNRTQRQPCFYEDSATLSESFQHIQIFVENAFTRLLSLFHDFSFHFFPFWELFHRPTNCSVFSIFFFCYMTFFTFSSPFIFLLIFHDFSRPLPHHFFSLFFLSL
jgi:hypothetical protein